MVSRSVCIHAHFYQPPRENPWLEEVELQDSAYPYHDWNERITAECYAPNTAARILGEDGRIHDIVNTYSRISFNFGPTLLSWMERHEPHVYAAILNADEVSRKRFSGHGAALAQVYNHIIMPLANRRDKETQVIWGIEDFVHRFGREPEGMWLAETAVDIESLELMVKHGIKFTVLAPRQASQVRKVGDDEWEDVSDGRVDPRRPYRCTLPSGASISLFFYDGHISQEIAFGELLRDGTRFAGRLMGGFEDEREEAQLVHIATDGETYGHHQTHGDMALAYCLQHIEEEDLARVTIYGEYLDQHEITHEVEIFEDSSWSCVHGVERWRSNCGCNTGGRPDWTQEWRAPLRQAFDWLRDCLIPIYEEHAGPLLKDPWAARDAYIKVIRDRSDERLDAFFGEHAEHELSREERTLALKLLEIQRHALLMYTSCAWFFDEVSGIETVQVIQYAARAMQLLRETVGMNLEPAFVKILERAKSNLPELEQGGAVYERYIKPTLLDLVRVGAHYSVTSLFEEPAETSRLYCYEIEQRSFSRSFSGRQTLSVGELVIESVITRESAPVWFAALHLGETNIIAGVEALHDDGDVSEIKQDIVEAFSHGDIAQVVNLLEQVFEERRFTLWHLFRDDQRRVMNQLVEFSLKEVDVVFRQMYQHHQPLIQVMDDMRIPLPKPLGATTDFVCNADLRTALDEEPVNLEGFRRAAQQVKMHRATLDKVTLGYKASRRIVGLVDRLVEKPLDPVLLETVAELLQISDDLDLPLNLWAAQNAYMKLLKSTYAEPLKAKDDHPPRERKVLDRIESIAGHLQVGG